MVAEEALVLQRNQDALLGSEINLGAWCTILHMEHVLLQPGRGFGKFFEVTPLVCAGDDAGRED